MFNYTILSSLSVIFSSLLSACSRDVFRFNRAVARSRSNKVAVRRQMAAASRYKNRVRRRASRRPQPLTIEQRRAIRTLRIARATRRAANKAARAAYAARYTRTGVRKPVLAGTRVIPKPVVKVNKALVRGPKPCVNKATVTEMVVVVESNPGLVIDIGSAVSLPKPKSKAKTGGGGKNEKSKATKRSDRRKAQGKRRVVTPKVKGPKPDYTPKVVKELVARVKAEQVAREEGRPVVRPVALAEITPLVAKGLVRTNALALAGFAGSRHFQAPDDGFTYEAEVEQTQLLRMSSPNVEEEPTTLLSMSPVMSAEAEEESTTLLLPSLNTAVSMYDDGEEETTLLIPTISGAAAAALPKGTSTSTTAALIGGSMTEEQTTLLGAVPPTVQPQAVPLFAGEPNPTIMKCKAASTYVSNATVVPEVVGDGSVWYERAVSGVKDSTVLSTLLSLPNPFANTNSLATPLLYLVLGMRAYYRPDESLFPKALEAYTKQACIIPECVWPQVPGAEQLNEFMATRSGTNQILVEFGSSRGSRKDGAQPVVVGQKLAHSRLDVIKALAKTTKEDGRGIVTVGYDGRALQEYTRDVLNITKFLLCKNLNVILPTETYQAVKLFVENSGCTCLCNFVELPTNWLMPLAGLEYDVVESAFVYLESVVQAEYRSHRAGCRPISYTKEDYGFKLVLSGGDEFQVVKGNAEFAPHVYLKAAGSYDKYYIRPFVASLPRMVEEVSPSYIVKLSSLDALWYLFETYGFAALNRENTKREFRVNEALGGYITRFVTNQMHVEYMSEGREDWLQSNRQILEDNKFASSEVAMPAPVCVLRTNLSTPAYISVGGTYLSSKVPVQTEGKQLTEYYLRLAEKADLKRHRVNVLQMIKACALAHNLTNSPLDDASGFLADTLIAVKFNGTSRAQMRQRLLVTLKALWVNAGFEETFGKFDPQNTAQIVNALWTKPDLADLARKAGIQLQDAQGAKSDEFLDLVARVFRIAISSKGSKAVKRVLMSYSLSCEVEGEEILGYRTSPNQINKAKLVPAVKADTFKTSPGMAKIKIDAVIAFTKTKDQVNNITLPQNTESIQIELLPEFQAIATDLRVNVDNGNGVEEADKGWLFPDRTFVEKDTILGKVLIKRATEDEPCAWALVVAGTTGYLQRVVVEAKLAIGGEWKYYVFTLVKEKVTNTLKLRSAVVLKANVQACNMLHFLEYRPDGKNSINSGIAKNVEFFIPGDSDKSKDNFRTLPILAAVNCVYYAPRIPELRELVIATNRAVYEFLGEPVVDNAEYVYINDGAIAAGLYEDLVGEFTRRFKTDLWHYERTPVSDLPKVRISQTRDRAVATAYALTQPNGLKDLQGAPWRFVGSDEARTLVSKDGKIGLPGELLFDIEVQERNGTYFNAEVEVGTAYIVTDAPVGTLSSEYNISCAWSVVDKSGNIEYRLLDRFTCLGPKDGLDLMYPVEVEAGTIPQARSSTNPMAFVSPWLAIEGHQAATARHMQTVKKNTEFDGILRAFLAGISLQAKDNPKAQTYDVTKLCAQTLLNREAAEKLKDESIYLNDSALLKLIAEEAEDNSFSIPYGNNEKIQGYITLHLGTLWNWSAGSLEVKGETAIKYVALWFRYWLVFGMAPTDTDMLLIGQSIFRMLRAYYNGKNHIKSTLRGATSVYMKAAACSLIPNDELWITFKDAKFFARTYGLESYDQILHVMFRRMPMFQGCVTKLRVLSKDDLSFYRKEYGVLFATGLAYMGTIAMYSNFGDLDGDAIEIADVSQEVREGHLQVTTFNDIREMLAEILGYDVFDWHFWLTNAPAQYIADHFNVPTWRECEQKSGISWKKNCTTIQTFAEFQLSAAAVQTVTVGLTYRVAVVMLLLAEILPKAEAVIRQLNDGNLPTWTNAFAWMFDQKESKITISRLLQLYEIALGGYEDAMAIVTLGYLTRAQNVNETIEPTTPTLVKRAMQEAETTDFASIMPNLASLRKFNHVPLAKVQEAMTELGFQPTDLAKFRDAFLFVGLCTSYKRKADELSDKLPVEVQLIFTIVQTILDISQVKLDVTKDGHLDFMSLSNYHEIVFSANQEAAAGNTMAAVIVELDQVIRTQSVTGQMFDAYMQNDLAINGVLADTTTPESQKTFVVNSLKGVKLG